MIYEPRLTQFGNCYSWMMGVSCFIILLYLPAYLLEHFHSKLKKDITLFLIRKVTNEVKHFPIKFL